MVRGYWVVDSYYNDDQDAVINGWFATSDVATIDADGYMHITDRSKDVIKSGGEWISSITLESISASHPAVQMAACIGRPHPKWGERPLLIVVPRPDSDLTRNQILEMYRGAVAKWWVPTDVVFVDEISLAATGKLHKLALRERFKNYIFPE